jgi:hypothetical protein
MALDKTINNKQRVRRNVTFGFGHDGAPDMSMYLVIGLAALLLVA